MHTSVNFRQLGAVMLLLALFFSSSPVQAQNVAITEDGSAAHPSALLDVKSLNKGVLFPRMSKAQRTSILSPATGLLVYQTDGDNGYYYFDGSNWVIVGKGESHWKYIGKNLVPTFNNLDLPGSSSFVGIGTDLPLSRMHIVSKSTTSLLTLENTTDKAVTINMTLDRSGDFNSDAILMQAYNYKGEPILNFERQIRNFGMVGRQQLMELNCGSDTVLTAFGDIRAKGKFVGESATLNYTGTAPIVELLHVWTEKRAMHGIHIDLNNVDFGGIGLASHVRGTGVGVEGWSEKGTGAKFSSSEGMALVTTQGKVAFGAEKGDGQVTIEGPAIGGGAELLLQSSNNTDIHFRKKTSATGSFRQVVMSSDGASLSLQRQETTFNPAAGTAMSSISGLAEFGGTHALSLHGDAKVYKEVNTQANANSNMLPIAYGSVMSNAGVMANSSNVSCSWDATYQRYEITIAGENYLWTNYITNVTPMSSAPLVAKTASVGGKLLVELFTLAGVKTQGHFQFSTFKP
jgi:hypothetical protein